MAALLLLFTATPAAAAAPTIPLRQFQHTAWTLQAGAPSQINALAQTVDGYLWLGTANGLFRFDGVTFEAYQPPGQRLPQAAIYSLLATKDGGLWIGYTVGGTSFLKDGILQTQKIPPKHGGGTVCAMAIAADGSIWAATLTGLMHYYAGEWHDPDENDDIPNTGTYSVYEDSTGALWVATDGFVYRRPRGSKHLESTGIKIGSDGLFSEDPQGAIWVMDGIGILRYSDWQPRRKELPYVVTYKDTPFDLLFDNSGALWVLGAKTGVSRVPQPSEAAGRSAAFRAASVEHFDAHDGLTSDRAYAALKDREGNIWIATPEGLDRFRVGVFDKAPLPSTFGQYALLPRSDGSLLIGTERDGLHELKSGTESERLDVKLASIDCVYAAADGKIWLGGTGELGYLEGDHFFKVALPPQLKTPARETQAMTAGPNGDLWLQTASKNPIVRLHDGQWVPVDESAGAAGAAVVLTTDHRGRVWAGFMRNVVKIYDGSNTTILDETAGLTTGNVTALYESGSTMWIGGENGLNVVVAGHVVPAKFAGGTSIDGISGIIRQLDGTIWINALPGVVRIAAQDVEHFLKDPSFAMGYRLFNYLDGLSGKAPQLRPLPSIRAGVDSTLWFITTNGAVSLDTANIYRNALPPPVSIQKIVVDAEPIQPHELVSLGKGANNIEIDYAALSLSMPERVLFRYKLDGYDKAWQEPGTRRQAFYANLPPGHYTFHVIASNNDGVWNDTGASLLLDLPPTFVQSSYFKVLVGVLLIATVWLLLLFRIHQETAKVKARLYERFSERERIARDLHDTFFQGIQGLLLSFHSASRRLPAGDATRRILDETLAQSDAVMIQGRELVLNLRTTSRGAGDLGQELETSAREFARHNPKEFQLSVLGEARALNHQVFEELCSIGREALCNAYQHSRAALIEVTIEYRPEALQLSVRDNGSGISHEILIKGGVENHWGLPGMKERAATIGADFNVLSSHESGTLVRVKIPSKLAYAPSERTKTEMGFRRYLAIFRNS